MFGNLQKTVTKCPMLMSELGAEDLFAQDEGSVGAVLAPFCKVRFLLPFSASLDSLLFPGPGR